MSLIHRRSIKSGTSTDLNNTNYMYLDSAVRKADAISKQSGKSLVTELAPMISPMVEALQKIVLSETASTEEKLSAASLAQQMLSKIVANETNARKQSVARSHVRVQKDRLAERTAKQADKRAKRAAQVAEQLRQAERELGLEGK
jgi:hypothetical protein